VTNEAASPKATSREWIGLAVLALPCLLNSMDLTVLHLSAEFGGALGIAVFGSIGIAIYRRAMAAVVPPGVPDEAADAARDTLGGAIATAAELPEELGAALVGAARIAFIDGMQLTVGISAVGTIAKAVFVYTQLRNVRTGTEAQA
jgi:DHA2 family multidrug resistance protein-like MFS transporter